MIRITLFLLAGFIIASCSGTQIADSSATQKKEILYIFPDGRLEFKGRTMNKEDVVIYKDGRGGERAAVRLYIPRHPDVFRDTITVERIDVPVKHRDDNG